MKKQLRRRNINFRQTHSERSATNSYRAFKRVMREAKRPSNPKI